MSERFVVKSSPHIRTDVTTQVIMRDVLIALAPTLLLSIF